MRKYTIQTCRDIAISKNGICRSKTYKNYTSKLRWECNVCGNIWKSDIGHVNRGQWCTSCSGVKKHTIEECKEIAMKRNGVCLDTKYVNGRHNMLWKCNVCDHEWKARLENILSGTWCPNCVGQIKYTLEQCKQHAVDNNGLCFSSKYRHCDYKMKWKCNVCDHEWKSSWYNVRRGAWCVKCSGKAKHTIQECKDLAVEKGGVCMSETYVGSHGLLKWQCNHCAYIWKASYSNVSHGTWCPKCAGGMKHTIEYCKEYAINHNGICISNKYINGKKRMKWQCDRCGTIWKASFNSVHSGSWCPSCRYKTETLVRKILEEIIGASFPKKRPEWLKGLELDGYCKKMKMAFEYNGAQHYEYVHHFHRNEERFVEQQRRDKDKIRRCNVRGVKLFVIHYGYTYRKPDEMRTYIENMIEDYDIEVADDALHEEDDSEEDGNDEDNDEDDTVTKKIVSCTISCG